MEATPPPANAETAYAATGDHHLFLLTVNAVLAAAIHGGYLDRFKMWRYDVPAAFLQLPLPVPYYGRLPADLPEPLLEPAFKIATVSCTYCAELHNTCIVGNLIIKYDLQQQYELLLYNGYNSTDSNGYNSTYQAYISTVSHHISIHVTTHPWCESDT